jgi:acetyl-CoA carboxylase biotin carboxyl carrier protein
MTEKFILTLIDRFSSASLGELNLDDGTTRLILRKEISAGSPSAGTFSAGDTSGEGPSGAETEPRSELRLGIPVNAGPQGEAAEIITSPIVATFYVSPRPDAPPFVKTGAVVKAGDTLCILEAMKMMNHLEAEFDCEILAVHAGNGDLVEYGQALFEVKRL